MNVGADMKTKTFDIEVITTKRVRVALPVWCASPEARQDWEKGLWKLDGDTPDGLGLFM